MPTTERRTRRIDERLPRTGNGTLITLDTETVPEAVPTPQQVTGLAVTSTFLAYTSIAPQAVANLRWHPIAAPEPESYLVQWSLASNFSSPTTMPTARAQTTAAVDGLPPGGTVYFRVAAVWRSAQGAWSASVNSTMPVDTTPPAAPTSAAGNWSPVTGDLTLTWTNPTSANFKDVEVRIYANSGGTLRRTVYSTTGRYVYTLAQNNQDTTNNPDPSLYVEFQARNYNNVLSATSATLTTTLSAPATPSGLSTDFTSPDLVATWTASNSVAGYEIQFGTATIRDIGFTNTFTYSFAQNAADNGSPATTIAVNVWAIDALGQVSATPATASAVTPLPIAPTSVTLNGFFSTLTGSWTHSPTRTFRRYRCRLTRGGVDLLTEFSTVQFFTASVTSSGSYELFVRTEDVFNQTSSETTSGTITLVSLSIEELRATAIYSDSVSNTVATLDALKDNNTTSGGVTYNSNATYRWTEMARSLEDRYKTLTIGRFSVTSGTTFYVRTFDGTNTKWFSGPITVSGDTATLTNVASEAAAQSAAVDVNSYTTRTRWELPTIEEAVNIRLYHRNTGSNYVLYEFYPRRLVQSDDIQAESILAINIAANTITATQIAANTITAAQIAANTITAAQIAAGTITATQIAAGTITGDRISSATTITAGSGDQIAVLNGAPVRTLTDGTSALTDDDGNTIIEETFRIYAGNAIAANAPFRVDQFGNLTATSASISGNITSNTTIGAATITGATITGGVITGTTIQTSAGTGARVVLDSNGLATYNSSNVVQIEATTANNGELRAGNGVVRLNSSGIVIASSARLQSIQFKDSTNTTAYGSIDASSSGIFIDAAVDIILNTNTGSILLVGENDTTQVKLDSGTAAAPTLTDKLDTDTGIFFPTGNAIGFSTGSLSGGVERFRISGANVNVISGSYQVAGTQVVGARITGWGAPTGTATRTAFATGSVTLAQLAERVKALIDDLTIHGLIGA